jgi:hypothetical protein
MARSLLVITGLMTATAVGQQPPVEPAGTVRQLHGTMIRVQFDRVSGHALAEAYTACSMPQSHHRTGRASNDLMRR